MGRMWMIVAGFGAWVAAMGAALAQPHPFLIVTTNQYPELQARTNQTPWREIKDSVEAGALTNRYAAGGSWAAMEEVVNDCALAYILEPSLRPDCKTRVLETLFQWTNDVYRLNATDHNDTVDAGAAFFMSVIALDIIHDDCSSNELAGAEGALASVYDWYNGHNTAWPENLHACRLIWAAYKGLPESAAHATNYYNFVNSEITEDGLFTSGPGYVFVRMFGPQDRTAKTYAMDVLEFTGIDRRYYSNPRIQRMYQWSFAFALSPSRRLTLFGDTIYSSLSARYGRLFSLDRFSPDLARQGAWLLNGGTAPDAQNSLFPYVLQTNALPQPQSPASTIYRDGGAAFWDRTNATDGLMGALYNATQADSHSHQDINSIYIAAYGETLIRNSGAYYWPSFPGQTPDGDPWRSAFLQNVVVTGAAKQHAGSTGNGISEGFVGHALEYASGDSGGALGDVRHQRNLLFVRPQSGRANGYFVLMDEVTTATPGETFQVLLHPNATNDPATVADRMEYRFPVSAVVQKPGTAAKMTVFMGTEPDSVAFRTGYFGSGSGAITTRYVEAACQTGTNGIGHMVTVLFPHDDKHTKASITRLALYGASGARIAHVTGVVDVVMESDGTAVQNRGAVSFRGLGCLYRTDGTNALYWVRKGRSFDDGDCPRHAFEADADVTVVVDACSGTIISPGGPVTLFSPGIQNPLLDGSNAEVLDSGRDWLRIYVPSGTHAMAWSAGPTGIEPGEASEPSPTNGAWGLSTNVILAWAPGSDSIAHDVYFGTSMTPPFAGSQPGTNYAPGPVAAATKYYWRIDEKTSGGATVTGAVWSFTTEPMPPAHAIGILPLDHAVGVSTVPTLRWQAGRGADAHDLYFGFSPSPPFRRRQTGTSGYAGPLTNATTYYWRIDEVNDGGTTTGQVWSFTTVVPTPGRADGPSPTNGAADVSTTAPLSWTPGSGAASHDVYVGAPEPLEFRGNQTGTTFHPGLMDYGGAYGWRVDEVNEGGKSTGTVWTFTTVAPALTIARRDNAAAICWPTNACSFALQSTTNLALPPGWSGCPIPPAVVDGLQTVVESVGVTQRFYRLHKP